MRKDKVHERHERSAEIRECPGQASVATYLQKAKEKEIAWPLPDGMDAKALEQLLFPSADSSTKTPAVPNWSEIATELQAHHHLTLQLLWLEFREQNPNGLSYSRFCARYRDWNNSTHNRVGHYNPGLRHRPKKAFTRSRCADNRSETNSH